MKSSASETNKRHQQCILTTYSPRFSRELSWLNNVMDTETINKVLEGVTDEQRRAIEHVDTHARLLAGPGTGKTHVLTRKVLWLILKHKIPPMDILALTFTRLAAAQLRRDLAEALNPHKIPLPTVSTLHSFALKQILSNSGVIE